MARPDPSPVRLGMGLVTLILPMLPGAIGPDQFNCVNWGSSDRVKALRAGGQAGSRFTGAAGHSSKGLQGQGLFARGKGFICQARRPGGRIG